MKRITTILSALLVVLTISARPALDANVALKSSLKATAFEAPKSELNLAQAPIGKIRKAAAIDNINLTAEQFNLLDGEVFTWEDDNPNTAILFMYIYSATTYEEIANGGWYSDAWIDETIGDINYYSASTLFILYYGNGGEAFEDNTTTISGYPALKPGDYIFEVVGTDAGQTTQTFDDYILFSIVSNEVTDLKSDVNSEKTQATITWDGSAIPEGSYAIVDIYTDSTLVYENYDEAADEIIILNSVTIDVEDGLTYEVYIRVYTENTYAFNPGLFPNGNGVSHLFTVGTNKYAPIDLEAVVTPEDSLEVNFSWTLPNNKENSVYYVVIYEDEYETEYGVVQVDSEDKNEAEAYFDKEGTFYWTVVGLEEGWYLTEEIKGGFFTVKDNVGPQFFTSEEIYTYKATNTTVNLTINPDGIGDNLSLFEDLLFTLKDSDNNDLLTDVAADDLLVEGLTKGTVYHWKLSAKDEAGNLSFILDGAGNVTANALDIEVETTDDVLAPAFTSATLNTAFDKYVTINVEASDNFTPADEIRYAVIFEDDSEVVLDAEEGVITVAGLIPETEYTITVKAIDNEGLRSEGKEVTFTTTAIIPITLKPNAILVSSYGEIDEGVYGFEVNLYTSGVPGYLPDIYFTVLGDRADKLSGEYSVEEGNLLIDFSSLFVDGTEEEDEILPSNATLNLQFVQFAIDADVRHAVYNASFRIEDADNYNIYQGTIEGVRARVINAEQTGYVNMNGEDIVAPEAEELEVSGITTTSADFSIYAWDGANASEQAYSYGKISVKLFNAADDSELGEFEAAGSAQNVDYYLTVENLTPNTTYNVYALVTDENGNKSEKIEKTFKTLEEAVVISTFKITLVAEHGTITVDEDNIDLNAVEENTVLHFTATPAEGYQFKEWIGYDPATGLTVVADATVEAVFEEITEGLEDISADGQAHKVVINGNLYIVRPDGKVFNVTGAQVK